VCAGDDHKERVALHEADHAGTAVSELTRSVVPVLLLRVVIVSSPRGFGMRP
jgi:hypothetical protein